jgi:hypothetical protein
VDREPQPGSLYLGRTILPAHFQQTPKRQKTARNGNKRQKMPIYENRQNMAIIRSITKEEWRAYSWTKVGPNTFIRGIRYTLPPDDGYEYVEITSFNDDEQKWVRALTNTTEDKPNVK